MKKLQKAVIMTGILLLCIPCPATKKITLVHNTHREIVAKENTLQLKLIRTWGGEDEPDEEKFFEVPSKIALDSRDRVYISDTYNFCIKVFDAAGKYIRTIGRKGRGPGDLIGPGSIGFSTSGNLWVLEKGNRRFQCFDAAGKSKTIFKYKHIPIWMSVTGKDEIAVYSPYDTHKTRELITLFDEKGKRLRGIGTYHDPSKNAIGCEWLAFAKDHHDNFYAGNMKTPIVRKYNSGGTMVMAFTFETPDKIRPNIELNERGNEIVRKDFFQNTTQIKRKEKNVIIDNKGKRKYYACIAIGTDSQENIYVVTDRRRPTEKESGALDVMFDSSSFSFIDRSKTDFEALKNIDWFRLIVFNPSGQVIAGAVLYSLCQDIYIHDNRLFIIDGMLFQTIFEYEMTIKE